MVQSMGHGTHSLGLKKKYQQLGHHNMATKLQDGYCVLET